MKDSIKGTTSGGFRFEIEKDRLDNYELLEAFGELEENPTLLTKVIKMMLGEEQHKRLKEHCRGEDGIVSATLIELEISEILNEKQLKKF